MNALTQAIRHQFTPISKNAKTGPIPTTMTERVSCPSSCNFRGNGCYAENFPLSLHWSRVESKGISFAQLLDKIRSLPAGQLWRHNAAGDLPHIDGNLDGDYLSTLAANAAHTRPIIYTHHDIQNPHNAANIRIVQDTYQVTVNASCESLQQAEQALNAGINAVAVTPSNAPTRTYKTAQESTVVTCPATYKDHVTCASCGLCARDRRTNRVIVAFPAHGAQYKKINLTIGA